MKTIQLIVLRSTIMDAVKTETFITSNADRAADEKASRLAYHEAAGDDEYIERKLSRIMLTAAEELKTYMSDYAIQKQQTIADNSVLLDMSDTASIKYRMEMSDRFNDSYVDTLARLASEYITNKMLMLWWTAINQNKAAAYFNLSEGILPSIMRCFNRTPPVSPSYPYPTEINVVSYPQTMKKRQTALIKYSFDDEAINDVEGSSLNLDVLSVKRADDFSFSVKAVGKGIATVQLYSRHDPTVKALVIINVSDV